MYVDADACPVKDEVYRVARRYAMKVMVVANSHLRVPTDALVELVVRAGFGAADDWIADQAGAGDVVVTADIPLAARCVARGAAVLDPRGRVFTEADIGEALAMRDLMTDLRQSGTATGGPPPLTPKDRSRFLSKLDDVINAVRHSIHLLHSWVRDGSRLLACMRAGRDAIQEAGDVKWENAGKRGNLEAHCHVSRLMFFVKYDRVEARVKNHDCGCRSNIACAGDAARAAAVRGVCEYCWATNYCNPDVNPQPAPTCKCCKRAKAAPCEPAAPQPVPSKPTCPPNCPCAICTPGFAPLLAPTGSLEFVETAGDYLTDSFTSHAAGRVSPDARPPAPSHRLIPRYPTTHTRSGLIMAGPVRMRG